MHLSQRARPMRELGLALLIGSVAAVLLSYPSLSSWYELKRTERRVSSFAKSDWSENAIVNGVSAGEWTAACMERLGVDVDILDGGSGVSLKWDYAEDSDVELIRLTHELCIEEAESTIPSFGRSVSVVNQHEELLRTNRCLSRLGSGMPYVPTFEEYSADPNSWDPFAGTPLGGWTVFSFTDAVNDPEITLQRRLQTQCHPVE